MTVPTAFYHQEISCMSYSGLSLNPEHQWWVGLQVQLSTEMLIVKSEMWHFEGYFWLQFMNTACAFPCTLWTGFGLHAKPSGHLDKTELRHFTHSVGLFTFCCYFLLIMPYSILKSKRHYGFLHLCIHHRSQMITVISTASTAKQMAKIYDMPEIHDYNWNVNCWLNVDWTGIWPNSKVCQIQFIQAENWNCLVPVAICCWEDQLYILSTKRSFQHLCIMDYCIYTVISWILDTLWISCLTVFHVNIQNKIAYFPQLCTNHILKMFVKMTYIILVIISINSAVIKLQCWRHSELLRSPLHLYSTLHTETNTTQL